MTFYDLNGKPIAYSEDEIHVYLFTGEAVAYFVENAVYGFNGKHLGWFDKGWVRDLNGACVFFSENASGSGPLKPLKELRPIKSLKQLKPIKSIREIKHLRAVNSLSWSPLSGTQFFVQ